MGKLTLCGSLEENKGDAAVSLFPESNTESRAYTKTIWSSFEILPKRRVHAFGEITLGLASAMCGRILRVEGVVRLPLLSNASSSVSPNLLHALSDYFVTIW